MGLGMKSEMLGSPAEGVIDWEPQLSCPKELLVRRGGSPDNCCPRYCITQKRVRNALSEGLAIAGSLMLANPALI